MAVATLIGMDDVYLGRQPILDRNQSLHAFELLFRDSGEANRANVSNDLVASSVVMRYALSEFGLEHVLGKHPGFINCDAELLQSDIIELLPPDRVVLEILETVSSKKSLVERCIELKGKGYHFALDDFQGTTYKNRDFIDVADIIKVDIMGLSRNRIVDVVKQVQGKKAVLLAEKVETVSEFVFCHDLGFELFQGYFFSKPEKLSQKRHLTAEQVTVFQLLSMLRGDAGIETILDVFKINPGLSVGLLRLCNSAAMGIQKKVTSIKSALVYLGRTQLQRWLLLLLMSHTSISKGKQMAFAHMASARGKLMELIASSKNEWKNLAEQAFIVGIVSVMGPFLGMESNDLSDSLALTPEMVEAITDKKGILGQLLSLVEAIEKNDSESIAMFIKQESDKEMLAKAQFETISWVNSVVDAMTG